jgi:ElaB/YqjD/DUF883 family membrane-anchored ribosome-binding protein
MAYQEQMEAVKQKVAAAVANTADSASRVADSAAKLADKAQTDGAALSRDIGNRAADLTGQVSDSMKSLGANAADLTATAGDAWDALEERFRELIRRRPVRAVAVSVAVGFLLGFMSRR